VLRATRIGLRLHGVVGRLGHDVRLVGEGGADLPCTRSIGWQTTQDNQRSRDDPSEPMNPAQMLAGGTRGCAAPDVVLPRWLVTGWCVKSSEPVAVLARRFSPELGMAVARVGHDRGTVARGLHAALSHLRVTTVSDMGQSVRSSTNQCRSRVVKQGPNSRSRWRSSVGRWCLVTKHQLVS
jgi:hypothetical protein